MIRHSALLGLPTLLVDTERARCEISLRGAQVLSFIPRSDGRDILWCAQGPRSEDQALHGGIPVCWPWFAKQDRPPDALQHGFARTMLWQLVHATETPDGRAHVCLHLRAPSGSWPQSEGWPGTCHADLELIIGQTLTLTLRTVNGSAQPLTLTQALHSYFRVGDVRQVTLEGLDGLRYRDNLRGMSEWTQSEPWTFSEACDRIYLQSGPSQRIIDPVLQRCVTICSAHSHATVVWNPGAQGIQRLTDVPPCDWHQYLCVETANCGPLDRVTLPPGGEALLIQSLSVTPLTQPVPAT